MIPELVHPEFAQGLTYAERFAAWAEANPGAVEYAERLAAYRISRGLDVGVKQLWERLRWDYELAHGKPWKCNNNYTAHLARYLIDRHPEWAERIQTRKLRAA